MTKEYVHYGFDRMGASAGLFIEAGGKSYDSRKFLADPGCHINKGRFVEMMASFKADGFDNPALDHHIRLAALDFPF